MLKFALAVALGYYLGKQYAQPVGAPITDNSQTTTGPAQLAPQLPNLGYMTTPSFSQRWSTRKLSV